MISRSEVVAIALGMILGSGIGLLLVPYVTTPVRGAVYQIPIIKNEKGQPMPRGNYKITVYKGQAYMMIELPTGDESK